MNDRSEKKIWEKVIRASEEKLNSYDMYIRILLGSELSAATFPEFGGSRTRYLPHISFKLALRWKETHKMQI